MHSAQSSKEIWLPPLESLLTARVDEPLEVERKWTMHTCPVDLGCRGRALMVLNVYRKIDDV